MNQKEYLYFLFSCLPGVGTVRAQKLLAFFGNDPERILHAGREEIEKAAGLKERQAQEFIRLRESGEAARRYQNMKRAGIRMVCEGSAGYPEKLTMIPGKPLCLFWRGTLPEDDTPAAAVVGSRRCTMYGKMAAAQIGRVCAENGVSVISGLASGIDAAAGRAAVEAGGRTWAVLGCGVDICYPRENIDLFEAILESGGGILSEYPPGTEPLREHFPVRNRIISGLADVCVVVEAAEKSGSLITADQAAEQGKDILAVPGRMNDAMSSGCNRLLAQGAQILLTPADIVRHPDIQKKLRRQDE
ncbi:MAG: DNA-processing protein DprA [Lachnospiraceae bacterium]|jgi:DNA processing protein|nr:DNA-processing protein DprA [Lachnospiraceae bacterium]MCH4030745.1 DNA-processing protein DprA [Lachnospiraceae bacterium]MCH4070717.1 DNA-processing protein DprA [Lachnospiraceae bacterium]MCH4107107.1 DNA-processing protein DprA [Lachnospiraceae bacterium]MCI1302037.1 DNA-processing protein DprA [Lachnospiraceae bacterium]